jgi:hypothetical protein
MGFPENASSDLVIYVSNFLQTGCQSADAVLTLESDIQFTLVFGPKAFSGGHLVFERYRFRAKRVSESQYQVPSDKINFTTSFNKVKGILVPSLHHLPTLLPTYLTTVRTLHFTLG